MSRFDLQLQFLLDLDLDPEALAVEAVLVAQLVAGHGEVALVGVLVGAAPGVVDAHRVVGGDRAVEEGPLRLAAVLLRASCSKVWFGSQNSRMARSWAGKSTCVSTLSNGMMQNLAARPEKAYSIRSR